MRIHLTKLERRNQIPLWDNLAPPSRVIKPKAVIQQPTEFDASLLQMPLFSMDPQMIRTLGYVPEGLDLHETAIIPDQDFDALADCHIELGLEPRKEPESVFWTDDDVARMHSVLLWESLAILAGRGNGMQKVDVLDWMFEPDYFGTVTMKNGQIKHVFNWEVPWSFLFCCKLEGMSDPDILRDYVRKLLPAQSAKFFC